MATKIDSDSLELMTYCLLADFCIYAVFLWLLKIVVVFQFNLLQKIGYILGSIINAVRWILVLTACGYWEVKFTITFRGYLKFFNVSNCFFTKWTQTC